MDWLKDIVKTLAISRTLVAAVFITTAAMYLGPIFFPGRVPQIQADYVAYLFAAMVMSGCLLVLWGIAAVWSISNDGIRKARKSLRRGSLSNPEIFILHILGKDPTQPLSLSDIDYSRAPATKLEFHNVVKQLEAKDLVTTSEWDENLVWLTEEGRVKALDILRIFKSRRTS
jgi:hypothetical protein